MASDIDICNRALSRLGISPITSFTDGTDKAGVCDLHYKATRDLCLSVNVNWRFCMQKAALSRLSSVPANVWQYEYQLPSNLKSGPHRVYNSSGVGAQPVADGFEIYGTTLATDYTTVIIDYTLQVDESKFPDWFVILVELALAGALAKNLTDQDDLAVLYHQAAFGPPSDNMRGGYFATCCQINGGLAGQQGLNSNLLIDAMIS